MNHRPTFAGHYKLWILGFEHRDPSLYNLMICHGEQNKGVLNDWDLSCVRPTACQGGASGVWAGTIPFIALDLLRQPHWDGEIERLYRHDLEGLIWVLPWVFEQFMDGRLTDPKLGAWCTSDYITCSEKKGSLLHHLEPGGNPATESWKTEWGFAYTLLCWVDDEDVKRAQMRRQSVPPYEPSPQEVYDAFCATLDNAKKAYKPLNDLFRQLHM